MGTYTRLFFEATLSFNHANELELREGLAYLSAPATMNSWRPTWSHPVFSAHRSRGMLRATSGGGPLFVDGRFPSLEYAASPSAKFIEIAVNAELKNEENEIEKFLDWVSSFVMGERGKSLGFIQNENSRLPSIIRVAEESRLSGVDGGADLEILEIAELDLVTDDTNPPQPLFVEIETRAGKAPGGAVTGPVSRGADGLARQGFEGVIARKPSW